LYISLTLLSNRLKNQGAKLIAWTNATRDQKDRSHSYV
jgi:hypothetical protein